MVGFGRSGHRFAILAPWLLGALMLSPLAKAQVTFTVTVDDPDGLLAGSSPSLENHWKAAGDCWARRLAGTAELWVRIRPSNDVEGVESRSFIWSYLETIDGNDIFETGASVHIRNGYPASSFDPDIEVTINPAFLTEQLWFDPDPAHRIAPPDPGRLDACSVFLQGLGRALAFDGWMNGTDGSFPGMYRSTFDRLITFDGTDFSFVGSDAVSVYGKPVPITFGNPFHVGNSSPRPGADLAGDVMTGTGLARGTRYCVSELDWAMLKDARVPIRTPCPCDLNGDGFIEDADFAIFVAAYDLYDCADPAMPVGCIADFNHDGAVDDGDYVIFIHAYAEFICP